MELAFLKEVEKEMFKLENHPIYSEIDNLSKLKFFMQRHVYAVFDFMSLTKSLQNIFAPSGGNVWTPPEHPDLARFINEIVLAEESDEMPGKGHFSHFEMYLQGMSEVGGDLELIQNFIQETKNQGIENSLLLETIPRSSRKFMKSTFNLVNYGKPHEIAASFCYGREKIIPLMFQQLLKRTNIDQIKAPVFHYYLERHVELDGDSHGPLALKMLSTLCDSSEKWEEAMNAAISSMRARKVFWDEIVKELLDSYTETSNLESASISY